MPGTAIRLGPFTGGINTVADPTAVADTELQDCVNFELTLNQELVSRPPIKTTTDMSATWTERIIMLGVGFFSNTAYLFGGNTDGTYSYSGGVWTQLSSTFNAVACIQYNDKMYFLNEAGGAGISRTLAEWSPGGGFVILNPANLNTMLPGFGGSAMTIYKERLWIVPGPSATQNTSRLVFSDAGAPGTFTATTQFIDIKPGDGTNLIDLLVYTENLVLFKEHSTHVLQYSTDPLLSQVLEINGLIGASTKHCIVPFEASIFVFHTGRVYELDGNWMYQQINVKCRFEYDATTPSARSESVNLSLVGERLICRYFNRIYVLGLRTRNWTRWESASNELHNVGRFIRIPSDQTQAADESYYAGSLLTASDKVFVVKDGHSASDKENDGSDKLITCSITTKNYDLGSSYTFKKLYWWGADVVTVRATTGIANPISYSYFTSWGTLYNNNYKVRDLFTWGNPIANALISTTGTPSISSRSQVFIRFKKIMRYRKISFTLQLTTYGSTEDGPVKIFTMTMFTNTKQTVSEAVS